MKKPQPLRPGDRVAVVSLSRGLLGEPSVKHELELGLQRLRAFGLEPVVMPNALKGIDYLQAHPEARAADLKAAFLDSTIKGIICAIGGFDTYRLCPYLMEDSAFLQAVEEQPKVFTGFSDSTLNHLMFYRLGLQTFYGPCLLVDLAELDKQMLPYTKHYFEKLFQREECFEITSSPLWYGDRASYGPEALGTPRPTYPEEHGHEVLNGSGTVTGRLFGGCIESLYNLMVGGRYADEPAVGKKYGLLPERWEDILLFLETSELAATPRELENMLEVFRRRGILAAVRGLVVGKPIDERFYQAYKSVYRKVFDGLDTPVLYNLNFGHACPRCILPYGALARLDCSQKSLHVLEPIFAPA